MNLCLVSLATLFLLIIFWNPILSSVKGFRRNPAPYYTGDVGINCGDLGNSTALDGRQWFGDTGSRSVMFQPRGKSTSLTTDQRSLSADPVPYMTARVSATQFSYIFKVNPGQKFIRLHFYPSSYPGFEKSHDFFTVKAGPFTLLRNFSASLAADAMGVRYLIKEFCLNVEEDKYFNLTFSPSHPTKNRNLYAFVNGIEIVSMPTGLYYTPDGDLGAQIVGQKNRYFIDNSTALEMVQRLNIGGSSISPIEDFEMFRRWTGDANYLLESKLQPFNHLVHGIMYAGITGFIAPLKIYRTSWKAGKNDRAPKMHNFTWKIPVDSGFGYLVRLHFCDFDLEVTEGERREFNILINSQIAESKVDMIRLSGGTGVPIYRDYVVILKGDKRKGKFDLFIALQSADESVVEFLHGLEILKMSGTDNNLASPNPVPVKQVSTSWKLRIQNLLLAFGKRNVIVTGMTILIILLNIIMFKLRQIWEDICHEGIDTQSVSREQSCRRFSLAEIILATRNFSDAFLIGRGGFGNVYKGFICGGSEIVAVKRLKSNSKQGAREFWTEIETLSKIRHIHLVPLIGYCNEHQEMILVYEYMPRGTLADNLYKIGENGRNGTPLTWEQRLGICIGAARGLDYLHTGIKHGVIHRDVKDSNILLDGNLEAKVSDFGLSKLESVSESQGSLSMKVKGTFGYLDPDYMMTHKPTRKTDVYAFGVVMLVVLCGKPAVDRRIPWEPKFLSLLFRESMEKGDIKEIVDPSMQGKISSQSLKEFIKFVENCLHPQPNKRPTMVQVVTSLEYALEQQQNAMSSKSEELAVIVCQPQSGIMQPFQIDEFRIPPALQESDTGIPEEGFTSETVENGELESRREDRRSKEKVISVRKTRFWPWEALRKIGNPSTKKKDLLFEDGPASCFTISQILKATDNFNRMIIDDTHWMVYVGYMKALQKKCVIYQFKAELSDEELEEFRSGLVMLLQLRHSNLLSMIGYCYHKTRVFVVYERVDNNTLHSCLYDTSRVPLPWIDRIRICIGAAEGLNYLHKKGRIHGFLSPESILFECRPGEWEEWTPMLSAFGLFRLSPIYRLLSGAVSTIILGGEVDYIPPEIFIYGPLITEQYDVYSFGAVLLEVLCRRRAVSYAARSEDERNLKAWVRKGIKTRTLHQIIDSNLKGQIGKTCLAEFLKIAFSCLHDEPTERPTMGYIVQALKFSLQLQKNGDNHDFNFENVYQDISDFVADELLSKAISGISQQSQCLETEVLSSRTESREFTWNAEVEAGAGAGF